MADKEVGGRVGSLKKAEAKAYLLMDQAFRFLVEHHRAIIMIAVIARSLPLAQPVLAQGAELCNNLACDIGQGGWAQWMSVWKPEGPVVNVDGVLQGIGASQASCAPSDENFQMLQVLGASGESEQFFDINLGADPDVIDICGVSPQPADFARVLDANVVGGIQAPAPEILPVEPGLPDTPIQEPTPAFPVEPAATAVEAPGVTPPGETIVLDQYILPALGVVCGIPVAIWGVVAGIGLLRRHAGNDYEESYADVSDNNQGRNQKPVPVSENKAPEKTSNPNRYVVRDRQLNTNEKQTGVADFVHGGCMDDILKSNPEYNGTIREDKAVFTTKPEPGDIGKICTGEKDGQAMGRLGVFGGKDATGKGIVLTSNRGVGHGRQELINMNTNEGGQVGAMKVIGKLTSSSLDRLKESIEKASPEDNAPL